MTNLGLQLQRKDTSSDSIGAALGATTIQSLPEAFEEDVEEIGNDNAETQLLRKSSL